MVGRIVVFAAVNKFLGNETGVVVRGGELDARLVGIEGLHEHMSAARSPPRAAGNLRQKLKGALGRPEIGDVQADVSIDDAHQSDVGKVKSLGDHLCAEKDVDQSLAEGGEHPAVAAGLAHRVAVHPANHEVGKLLLYLGLQPFRADALKADLL